jgi:uncharacterized protein with ParB-like and HNH nuclease domain
MENLVTIKQMLDRNRIYISASERAYLWDTEFESNKPPKQVNAFLSDLEEYNLSKKESRYYFGHFLFEEKGDRTYALIDGKQRLTTTVIFLSALFARVKQIRPLYESEREAYEDTIKRNKIYRFETVDCDNQFFKDYVVDQVIKDKTGIETESAKRIANAFDYFTEKLLAKDESYLLKMLEMVLITDCTTYTVAKESNLSSKIL